MRRPERVVLLIVGLLLGGIYQHPLLPAPLLLLVSVLLALFNAAGSLQILRSAQRALSEPPRGGGALPERPV
jgi:hypothetical protein